MSHYSHSISFARYIYKLHNVLCKDIYVLCNDIPNMLSVLAFYISPSKFGQKYQKDQQTSTLSTVATMVTRNIANGSPHLTRDQSSMATMTRYIATITIGDGQLLP